MCVLVLIILCVPAHVEAAKPVTATVISSIAVTYPEPKAGQKVGDVVVSLSTDGVNLGHAKWFKNDESPALAASDTFEGGSKYALEVRVELQSVQFEFASIPMMTFNGQNQNYPAFSNKLSFAATSQMYTIPADVPKTTLITSIAVAVPMPVVG